MKGVAKGIGGLFRLFAHWQVTLAVFGVLILLALFAIMWEKRRWHGGAPAGDRPADDQSRHPVSQPDPPDVG